MSITDDTLALVKTAQSTPDDLVKSFYQPLTATTGLQAYNLDPVVRNLTPVMTPIRNGLARVTGGFATQANWKAVTAINIANTRAGVAEGRRGARIQHQQREYFAAFRGYGRENMVTFEAAYAAKNFDDVKARAVSQTLNTTLIEEERLVVGGNTSMALGTTPTPTLVASGAGGTLPTGTLSVIAVALTFQAYLDVAGLNNGAVGQTVDLVNGVPSIINRVNASGTAETIPGGSAQKSASATVAVTGPSGSVTATVTPVRGAVGYAWYSGPAGSELLTAVTNVPSVSLTAPAAAGSQPASALAASDQSASSYDFDGLLTMAFNPANNAFYYQMPAGTAGVGTGLTPDGAGGIAEFEMAFAYFFNRYRLSPTKIFCSAQEKINITRKIIANGGAPLIRFNTDAANPGMIAAGTAVTTYLNKVTGTNVELVVHPNMPAGTLLFYTDALPYELSGIDTVARMLMRQEIYQLEWPLVDRSYQYGVYGDGVLQHFAPFSLGVITGIGNI